MKTIYAFICVLLAPALLLIAAIIGLGFKSELVEEPLRLIQQAHANEPTADTAARISELKSTLVEMRKAEFRANTLLSFSVFFFVSGACLFYVAKKEKTA